jgi:hypothetical protein
LLSSPDPLSHSYARYVAPAPRFLRFLPFRNPAAAAHRLLVGGASAQPVCFAGAGGGGDPDLVLQVLGWRRSGSGVELRCGRGAAAEDLGGAALELERDCSWLLVLCICVGMVLECYRCRIGDYTDVSDIFLFFFLFFSAVILGLGRSSVGGVGRPRLALVSGSPFSRLHEVRHSGSPLPPFSSVPESSRRGSSSACGWRFGAARVLCRCWGCRRSGSVVELRCGHGAGALPDNCAR